MADARNRGMSVCRLCASAELREIIDLGCVPSIHVLRRELGEVPTFPIHVFLCPRCGLAQMPAAALDKTVYEGSVQYVTSHQGTSYIRDLVDTLSTYRAAAKGLEIGCNDGRFLEALGAEGFWPLVGVEPNAHTAAIAARRGFAVEQCFFNAEAAAAITARHGRFDFVVARHVLEHVDAIEDFMAGIDRVLVPEGVLLLELPYVEPGFAAGAVNVLWEEHINYFFEPVVDELLRNNGLRPEIRRRYTGGALVTAVFATRASPPARPTWTAGPAIEPLLEGYAPRVRAYRAQLGAVLALAARRGCLKAVYGAGFRAATTINTMGIGREIDVVIDDRPDLAGYLMPGTGAPIRPLAEIAADAPVLLMLAVGAEHERKVLAKARRHFGGNVIPLSLVYPGAPAAHCEEAARQLAVLNGTPR